VTSYGQLIRRARQAGVRTLLDCDGHAFSAAINARPFLVKPNEHELAQWRGTPLKSKIDLMRAALELSRSTGGWVLVSRGVRGAFLINQGENRTYIAPAPAVKTLNTVGAGDAMLAAVACQIAAHSQPDSWLRWGVAMGTAATQCTAGKLPKPALIRRVQTRMLIKEVIAPTRP